MRHCIYRPSIFGGVTQKSNPLAQENNNNNKKHAQKNHKGKCGEAPLGPRVSIDNIYGQKTKQGSRVLIILLKIDILMRQHTNYIRIQMGETSTDMRKGALFKATYLLHSEGHCENQHVRNDNCVCSYCGSDPRPSDRSGVQ
eukprot:GEMP01075230.1.p1 GENE.GEMP01075230.1~~GEMP01075230.1.p1  ORF type:complete len:142 (+),score=1.25 GEMP01075230.1:203-628(+)